MKILFTSVGRRVELVQAFRNAAIALNTDLLIYGADFDVTAPALQFCDKYIIPPEIKNDNYIPFLLQYCRNENIQVIIPTIDTDLTVLSENKFLFEKEKIKVLISSLDKIILCQDKRLTEKYFSSLGLSTPKTLDNIKNYTYDFPAFVKPLNGSASINTYKVYNMEHLKTICAMVPDYIIQPFISGKEYTVDIFCDFNGHPIYITPRIRLAVRAGEVLKTKIVYDQTIVEDCIKIINNFNPCGPITVQIIKDNNNINWFMEINPRFGGGAPLSMKAGADSAEALLRILYGEKLSFIDNAAENNVTFCRFDQSVKMNYSKGNK